MADIPSLVFISGGVRSGKSSFAEKKAVEIHKKTGARLHYLATGMPSDEEMVRRIEKHQQDRITDGYQWITIEQPTRIEKALEWLGVQDIILLDCVTTLLNNEWFSTSAEMEDTFLLNVKETIVQGISMLKEHAMTVIVVSNEVINDLPSENELVFKYQRVLGHIHQELVRLADEAYLVENGIPIKMKGEKSPAVDQR
ncbi:bifunctional adenosylcobinamide kinase/adenosylcobinamide-phosphate guanylyltransferase [Neobacillus sp. LXY-1]|uniref:bifunctional adenosylcobinamide kinase/adenosylcobinamide-phosphate guanylyltransferase n=1 Tax=Neobacillus sp. LXY-1 TaxID=3379133 RepID=UPI003EE33AF7